jgi:hypothetical protein
VHPCSPAVRNTCNSPAVRSPAFNNPDSGKACGRDWRSGPDCGYRRKRAASRHPSNGRRIRAAPKVA